MNVPNYFECNTAEIDSEQVAPKYFPRMAGKDTMLENSIPLIRHACGMNLQE
jgi:hypothetical protein